jgi:hypothetical protein
MNCRPLLNAKDEAFIQKWRWRLAICYSAILLSVVLGAVIKASQGTSGTADSPAQQTLLLPR